MTTVTVVRNQRFVLQSESWQHYVRLRSMFRDRRGVRITFDRGNLQLMTLSLDHEQLAMILATLVRAWTQERALGLKSGGSATFRRRDLNRGLEPDQCFWIANEPVVRNSRRVNLRREPPPDLVLEVEITRSAVPRLPIYAAFGFPEIWRLTVNGLTFNRLQSDGTYAPVPTSLALAPLSPNDLMPFLALRGQVDENSIETQFRAWIRQLPNATATP